MTTTRQREAIVIGASMGGLLAARALADFYDRVTLLERDAFPAIGENRKGVPQGQHTHGLLARGREVIEQFFPGITDELLARGASLGDLSADVLWVHDGAGHCRAASGLHGLAASRPLLEGVLRTRLLALPNVCAIEQCDVQGLATEGQRVTGVRMLRRADGGGEEVRYADLVVDASGRGSRTPQWLEAMGFERPVEEKVQIGVGYATRTYYRKADGPDGRQGIVMGAMPPNTRVGVLLQQEGDRFMVTAAGYFGDHPPTDDAGFLEFVRGMPTLDIYHAIRNAEPLSPITSFKYPASTRRRYERLTRFPAGYLAFGDALCSFNPVYGQGMTARALEALALQDCLRKGTDRLARRFFAAAARVIDIPWSMAVGNDLRFAQADAPRTPMIHFVNWYMSQLHPVAWDDPIVAAAFLRVLSLMVPPPSLLRPAIVWRVLRGQLQRRLRTTPTRPAAAQPPGMLPARGE